MPRRGEHRRGFVLDQLDGPGEVDPLPRRIGVWEVAVPPVAGRGDTVRLDTSRFRCRRLADELAQEWVEFAAVSRPHHATVYAYRQAVEDLCAFVDNAADAAGIDPADLADCSLAGEVPDVSEHIREWLRTLPGRWPEGSQRPRNLAQFVLVLIRLRGQHADRSLSSRVQRLTTLTGLGTLTGAGRTNELDEFSRTDKRGLVRAGWAEVRALEQRLTIGRELVAAGAHPGEPGGSGWRAAENLAWGLAHGVVTPRDVVRNLPAHPLAGTARLAELRRICDLAGVEVSRWGNGFRIAVALARLLYPRNVDLHAFRVLLVAATGHTPEEVSGLTGDDVEHVPGGVRLRMVKRRGRVVRSREFRDLTAVTQAAHPDRAGLNVSEILRRLNAATNPARSARTRHNEDRDFLFYCAAVTRSATLVFQRFQPGLPGADLAAWARRADVQINGPLDLRRLRKSVKVEKAIAFRGAVADVADDHTEQTFFGHYAHGTTLRVLSGHAISHAQQTWLDKALDATALDNPVDQVVGPAGPVVLDETAREALTAPEIVAGLGLTAEQADEIRQGELDMGVTSCRDPYDSPYSSRGELCAVAPLRCLECRNAFVLPSNLPQLLLFADHLEGLKNRLTPQHFHHLWGQQHANLRAVLAEHSDADLRQAQRQITDQSLRLQLPLAALAEFDT